MLIEVLKETFKITSFVMVIMLIIEFLNVISKGKLAHIEKQSYFGQLIVAALLGFIPGCVGGFAAVSLYTHRLISFGALLTATVTSLGDDAFRMFPLIPGTSIKLMGILFLIGIPLGLIVDKLFGKKLESKPASAHLEVHSHDLACAHIKDNLKLPKRNSISFPRAILIAGISLYLFGILSGELSHSHNLPGSDHTEIHTGHNHAQESSVAHLHEHESEEAHGFDWNGENIAFLIITFISLIIIILVDDHFLEAHLWGHVIKKHFLNILLWTAGTLLVLALLKEYFNIEEWLGNNMYKLFFVMILALIIGIIPQSGPHFIFAQMFATGTIPFSILLANSVVQDGHASLPLLAESRKKFIYLKSIKIIVGFIIGTLGLMLGF